jgi:hypothetical protein
MRTILSLLFLAFSISCYSQESLKSVLDKVDWHGTESSLVYCLKEFIEPMENEVWESEKTESNYRFKGMSVAGYPVGISYVRVKQSTKELYRINFIVLNNEDDVSRYQEVKDELIRQFGTPAFDLYEEEPDPVLNENKTIWLTDDYKVEATQLDLSNRSTKVLKYAYAVNVEPLTTYKVKASKAQVLQNDYQRNVPKFECFRIDNENNIYAKEPNFADVIHACQKVIPSPKGDVISFDDGMFCYRPAERDVLYILNSFVVSYPVVD